MGAQHKTPEYRAAKRRTAKQVQAGEAWCVEPICVMTSRWIEPGSAWDLCHDTTGTVITGPGHSRCNRSEGATRGNRMRGGVGRWVI